jgi:hypothetical protein
MTRQDLGRMAEPRRWCDTAARNGRQRKTGLRLRIRIRYRPLNP